MRQRQRSNITGPNGALLEYPLSTARFIAPLRNTLAPSAGYGPATFTRTTTASYFDNEGILKEVRAGAARFTGARRVANMMPYSEYDTPDNVGGTMPPTVNSPATYAGLSCVAVTFPTGSSDYNSSRYFFSAVSGVAGRNYRLRYKLALNRLLVGSEGIAVYFGGSDTWHFQTFNSASGLTSAYTELTAIATASASGSNTLRVRPNGLLLSDLTVYMTEIQLEDVTGQADQTASEYVHAGKIRPNYIPYTEDMTASSWINTNVTVTQNAIANPVDGRVNATKLEATATTTTNFRSSSVASASASGMTFSCYAKEGTSSVVANRYAIYNSTTASYAIRAEIDFSTLDITYVNNPSGGTVTVTSAGSGWFKIVLTAPAGFSAGDDVLCFVAFAGNSATAGNYSYAYAPTLVRGIVSDTTYTPVGADYDPHGSGVDGVKYFNTNKDGTPIPQTFNKGFLNEGARTNNLLWCRDLTNAAWVKTTMTTALTSTGIDGQASGATRLTATAGNATCLQTFTMASAARTFSAYVKRITGTGTIEITRNNGTSWTDITSLISTSGYTRVTIAGTSVTNPTCGFRIVTSGNAIDVDYCQDEAGVFPTNPIGTTTVSVTRNQDKLSYGGAGNYAVATGTCLVNFSSQETASTYSNKNTVVSAGSARPIYIANGGAIADTAIWDGTAGTSSNGASRASGTLRKGCANWQATTMKVIGEGASGSPSSNTFTGTMGDTIALYVGIQDSAGNAPLYGNIKDLYVWQTALTDNQMRQIVA